MAQTPYAPGAEEFCGGENIMMIVLGYFLIAAAAAIAASAIIGFFLTNLLIWLLQKVDRLSDCAEVKYLRFLRPTGF